MTDFGFVILSNDRVEAICVGTEAEAEAVCARLKAETKATRQHELGELAEHLLPTIEWRVRKARIISK